ncbi:hypothetical protein LOTGIDRAFT_164873 [Lottia gigantea]|uniref:HEPN domain-containing protein n=1 Tax=Lottia gigantea TaxID=225164 RepID=V3ZYW0_LOTGI|nr:hypothetical protein LOTGIDRAFT_164873 [Lottia gigantea]ESO89577.1 hypothetical protein LOTGIDRAFT_164873 [Lottia gigantea]
MDEASDEDFCEIELPPIIDQLKRLLEQYSDGQIIKELIQNAEDGGATEVKFLYTGKKHEEIQYSMKAWKETPIKIAMQAPAICVHNNGIFTDKDWKGIAAIQCSQKEKEPLKVGRFGLGFKSVFHLTEVFEESENDLIYRVQISVEEEEDLHQIRDQRGDFLQKVEELNGKLANEYLFHYLKLSIKCEGKKWLSEETNTKDWIVVNHYHGGSVSNGLQGLIDDEEWSYSPYVSVAGCLSNCDEEFKGHIYCFLPLPLERTSPTGLPVHINGFFALSQDRHHIKWMSSEEENRNGLSENSVEWNKILATEILPLVYSELLTYLTEADIDTNTIYKLLPKPELITENWKIFIKPLFKQLYEKNIIFTKASGGKWIKPDEATVLVKEEYPDTILKVIEDVYLLKEKNVACLPDDFVKSLKSHGRIEVSDSSCLHSFLIQHDDIFDLMDINQKMKLLEYFISNDIEKLQDLKILPLANGEFHIFDAEEETIFWCEAESLKLFPGMESRFMLNDLSQDISQKLIDRFQVKQLLPEHIQELLKECIEINGFRHKEITPQITDWLNDVWKYIHKNEDVFQLPWISHLHLLPFHKENKLIHVDSVSILSSKENMDTLDPQLSNSLEKLGVKIITSLSNTISALVEGKFVQYPTTEGIFNCMKKITSKQQIEQFNQEASTNERNQLLEKFANLSDDQVLQISELIQQLEIFEVMNSNRYVCLNEINTMYYRGSHPELPISYKGTVIKCTSESIKKVGRNCCCDFLEYEEIIEDILSSFPSYNKSEQLKFMEFFLKHLSHFEKEIKIMKLAGDICVIENKSGELVKPKDLLDPSSMLLKDMFQPRDFPSNNYDIKKLKKLGLRFEEDLTGKDILNLADKVIDDGTGSDEIYKKGVALCQWIDKYNDRLEQEVINLLTSKTICPIMNKRPEYYPKTLPFKGEDAMFQFKKPQDLFSCKDANLVGGVGVLSNEDIPQCFKTCIKPVDGEVFEQLKLVTLRYDTKDKIEFLPVLNKIYEYINNSNLKIPDEILNQKIVWTGSTFQLSSYVYCTGKKDDLPLQPYRYLLPPEMNEYRNLFEKFGCKKEQNDQMLLDVLSDIRVKHDANQTLDELDVSKDTSIVLQIINKLAKSTEDYSQCILLPIHIDSSKLLLKPASECTVCNESWLKNLSSMDDDDDDTDEDEIFYVHKEISSYTANRFNVPALNDRVLCDADKFDMNFGQKEPLTTRLKNLLNDYTDGFTVPKEIIQNADDAGASVVKFLYDERAMPEALTCLFDEGMEPVQGPAFWAYNDAKFTDTDYENITKLAGATKKDDQMKIGRFGLGFNSVYNLTDTPSFISGDTYVIFDPHETHLHKSGLKIKLNYSKNRKMRQKMKGQFYPFEGVFQCKVLNKEQVDFDGTLFRFPLRNQSEAAKSLIKDFCYSKNEMKEFIQKIADGCGNLLLFTQNVRRIELHHLHKGGKPNEAQLILEVTKSSNRDNTSALKILTSHNSQRQDGQLAQLSEEIEILVSVKKTGTAQDFFKLPHIEKTVSYLISWSFGKDKVVNAAKRKEFKGLLPIAGTAVLKNNQDDDTSNFGFYDKSHLFCFLPLPIPTSLPAHVNGSFAVQSSRRDLVWQNEDDIEVPGDEWNMCLLEDACCKAYLLMMTTMARDVPEDKYNRLWPNISQCTSRHDKVLSRHIYKTICAGDYRVFQSKDKPVSINNAIFLDPTLRDQDVIGEIALKALCHFSKTKMDSLIPHFDGGISVVDLLPDVWKQFKSAGCEEVIRHRMVTIETFYSCLFFPTLTDKFWSPEEIDELLLYSLQLKNDRINELIENSDCIPTKPNHKRLKPSLLIHPHGEIAELFDESEERFPDDTKLKTGSFRNVEVLDILRNLGMMSDDLPWDQMPERITIAVNTLNEKLIQSRFEKFMAYMSTGKENYKKKFEFCPKNIRQELSMLPFLPVKTLTWKFPQFTNSDKKMFVSTHEAYLQDLQEFVGCTSPIVDTSTRSYTNSYHDSILKWLGVKHSEQQLPLELVLENMLIMSQYHSQSLTNDLYHDLEKSFIAMYKYLNNKIDNSEETPEQNENIKQLILKKLKGKAVVLHLESLTTPDVLVLEPGIHTEPYISSTNLARSYEKLFILIGVLPKLTAVKILEILILIDNEKRDRVLEEAEINIIAQLCRSFVKLSDEERCSDIVSEKIKDVKLPDSEKQLTSISSLCFDDNVDVYNKDIVNIRHLHKKFDRNTAEVFGVKSKRGHSFDAISSPLFAEFGQHEELTNRIKRILEGYPCDESILKEMLQNADDAGATEVIFIKDFRTLPKTSLPDPRLEEVQGPALCVFNNSFFTEEDLKGIQDLGTGSKQEEVLKTGQYGVGFNVVYRVTDVPSFWSKGGDVGETLCIFDPHCKYLSMAHSMKPGVKIDAVGLKNSFPDFNEGFLPEFTRTLNQGTVFRLPLRNKQMAGLSKISKHEMTENHIDKIFEILKNQIFSSMLFLENITSVKFGTVKSNGKVQIDYTVQSRKQNQQKQEIFNNHLLDLSARIKDKHCDAFHLLKEVTINMRIKDSLKKDEEYLIVKRAGFKNGLPDKLIEALKSGKLMKLPRGGVAMNLKKFKVEGIAYCTLPLPIFTGLPVHVNGQFALDHESRRNIWNDETSVAGLWNSVLNSQIIVPAYLTLLEEFKLYPLSVRQKTLSKHTMEKEIRKFENLLPKSQSTNDKFWKEFVVKMYTAIGEEKRPFFPVLKENTQKWNDIEWVAVQTGAEFNGCFDTLYSYFKDETSTATTPYRSSGSSRSTHLPSPSVKKTTQSENITLKQILIRLGMKVLETSKRILDEFKQAEVKVQSVNPENVLKFLKSYQSKVENRCELSIPENIQNTPFGSLENFKLVLEFVLCDIKIENVENLLGSPLLLRQNNILDFYGEGKIIVTRFCDIFEEFAQQFIHSGCVSMLERFVDSFPPLTKWSLESFKEMFGKSKSYKLLTSGEIIPWNKDDFSLDWICNVWKFISQHLLKQDGHSTEKLIPGSLHFELLSRLSILPVRKGVDGFFLYPLSKTHYIFDSEIYTKSFTNDKMKEALLKLKIPRLVCPETNEKEYETARQTVASVDDPDSMVKLLLSNLKTSVCDCSKTAFNILKYFNDRIDDIKPVAKELYQLNLFETYENSLTTVVSAKRYICLVEEFKRPVPKDGINHWADTSGICILKYHYDIHKLFDILGIKCVKPEELYYNYILPNFHCFQAQYHLIHLGYVRDLRVTSEVNELICSALQNVKFLPKSDGSLYRACDFYDKLNDVFKAMFTDENFVPPPYNDLIWYPFLLSAGLVTTVSTEMFVQFTTTVEKLAMGGIDKNILRKSNTLLQHLKNRGSDIIRKENLLPKIKDIKFVKRMILGDRHVLIHKQFNGQSKSLVSFSGSFLQEDTDYVWTVGNVIQSSLVPIEDRTPKGERTFNQLLGISTEVSFDIFETNMKNVSSSLNEETIKKVNMYLTSLFEKFYKYLKKNIDYGFSLSIISSIFLPDEKKLVEPWRVIMKPKMKSQLINGRIFEAPLNYFKYFDVFESLGVKSQGEPSMYLKVLEDIYRDCSGNELHFHMRRLSQVVREKMIDDGRHGIPRTDIHHRLHHPEMIKSLIRVMKHLQDKNHKVIDDDKAIEDKVKQILDIKVISIENLTTHLFYNDNVIDGSEFKVKCFEDKLRLRIKVLYIDSKIAADNIIFVSRLSRTLGKILKENISEFFTLLWSCIKSNRSEMHALLDEMNIRQSGYECKLNEDIFPEAGTFIPEDKHWLLDNSYSSFYVGDYVGYELYDPAVNDETEDNVTDTPVYIYAVIVDILQEDTEAQFARYKIDIGDEENIDVDSTKIYKFHRNLTSSSREIVLSEDSQQGRIPSESTVPTDKKSILKEIRQLLTKAWKLSEADRKRVIKRLLLKWHPDKNPNLVKLATEITQTILNYIRYLEKGGSLDEDEDDDDKDYTDGASADYYSGGNYSSFYSNMHSRGRSYAQHSNQQRSNRSYHSDSSFHFHTGPFPRPDEARRWYKQARFDIEAAEESHNQGSNNYNWICYMCQQAAEKALKAVWYTIDSNKVSQYHNLSSIACGLTQYPELVSLADELQSCIRDHTRMRYPDTVHFPKVPKDVYDRNDSTKACQLTKQIVNYVSNIVHCKYNNLQSFCQ